MCWRCHDVWCDTMWYLLCDTFDAMSTTRVCNTFDVIPCDIYYVIRLMWYHVISIMWYVWCDTMWYVWCDISAVIRLMWYLLCDTIILYYAVLGTIVRCQRCRDVCVTWHEMCDVTEMWWDSNINSTLMHPVTRRLIWSFCLFSTMVLHRIPA